MGMDEHQRDVGIERQETEGDRLESAPPRTDGEDDAADRTHGPDEALGDARSPAT